VAARGVKFLPTGNDLILAEYSIGVLLSCDEGVSKNEK
jgi:hypothetical protein